MERLVGKKVMLRSKVTGTTLVASSDGKSVRITDVNYYPIPNGSVWLIKGKTPYSSVQLESAYGTTLYYESGKIGCRTVQNDRYEPGVGWVVEDIRHSGFRTVLFRAICLVTPTERMLCPATDGLNVELLECNLKVSRFSQSHFSHWNLEVVETPSVAYNRGTVYMQSLVGKRARLRNGVQELTIVASNDKKSVFLVNIDGYNTKPEDSVWLIKSDKSELLFESVYGTVLTWSTQGGLLVFQSDRVIDNNKDRWAVYDYLDTGFTSVVIVPCYSETRFAGDFFLRPFTARSGSLQLGLRCFLPDDCCYWDLEVVETPTITSSQAVGALNERISSASSSYQVDQMYVNYVYPSSKQDGKPDASFIFPNYNINSGRNVNESGTLTVGGINVQTRIVKRDG